MKAWNFMVLLLLLFSCQQHSQQSTDDTTQMPAEQTSMIQRNSSSTLDTAVFAEGCFWCAEAIFERVKGVKEGISGYAGGDKSHPTYEEVSSGTTGYAESEEVIFDPQVVSYRTLLKVFFASHDPTTLDRQGPDVGTQYRSAIFYRNARQKEEAEQFIIELKNKKVYDKPITTEVTPLKHFWEAEAYHQNYVANHPDDPYVITVSMPRIQRFEKKFPGLLKEKYK